MLVCATLCQVMDFIAGGKIPTSVKAEWDYDDKSTETVLVHFTNVGGKGTTLLPGYCIC